MRTNHATVCCIPAPQTGLEIKFSLAHLAAMALDGADTSALETFSDENALDPHFIETRERAVQLDFDPGIDRNLSIVTITLKDGRVLQAENSVRYPAEDHGEQWANLSTKFRALATPIIGAENAETTLNLVETLEQQGDVHGLMKASAG